MSSPAEEPRRGSHAFLGFVLLALLAGYTAMVYYGVGPAQQGSGHWYSPTAFLFDNDLTYALIDPPPLAFASLGLPALMLAIGVMLFTRSSLAAALGISCVIATLLFVFYGEIAPFPWQFFGGRGSAVLVLVALTVGFALAAPLLAGRWLRLRWPLRILTYLPFVVFVLLFLRNATGTDESLPFAISPWPAVPVFGLQVGALFVATGWIGTATGLAGLARSGGARGRVVFALAAGVAVPLLLLLAGQALSLLPFPVGPRLLGSVGVVCALAIGAAARLGVRDPAARAARGRRIGAGALLLAAPLLVGQAWAYSDYYMTRQVRARKIIDALQVYLKKQSLYPDSLQDLVHAGDLEAVPKPSIGFGFLPTGKFDYQSFGTSYLLQFSAPGWVQCAYTPAPVYDEDELAEREKEGLADEPLGESWSCPSRPPQLW